MTGYLDDPEATAAAIDDDGWLHTGDLAAVDDEGRFRLAGRIKEMYIRGGYNVYPAEVEAVLADHPEVAEVAVVPVLDAVMGEVGAACVVPRDPRHPPTLASLREIAAERLAPWKLPERLALFDELPRTGGDKIDRMTLGRRVLGEE
jgi:acyl-CoA synthetase (AMP-forming)/AMP-acid ligase II